MISQTLREHFLVDELQLGQTLNQAISQGHRSEFSLLLAMLSPDVEDQPWVADQLVTASDPVDWRRKFELPKARPLAADAASHQRAVSVGEFVASGSLLTAHLLDCLEPEPLIHQQYELDPLVWENMSPLTQRKYQLAREGESVVRDPLANLPPAAKLDSIEGASTLPELTVRYFAAA